MSARNRPVPLYSEEATEAGMKALAARHELDWVFEDVDIDPQGRKESERQYLREDVEAVLDAALVVLEYPW